MSGGYYEGFHKWEYVGHHVVFSSDLFLLCEQDRYDPETEPPFIACLLTHELYGMISFILKRMREIDDKARELSCKSISRRDFIPFQYRGRELQYFRMKIPKTHHHRTSELYNAQFVNDTDEGFDSCQGVFVTLERALGFLFNEIGFRSGSPSEKFVVRILKHYPEYEPVILRNIETARLLRCQENLTTSVVSQSDQVLHIHLSDEERLALFYELSCFFKEDDHALLMKLLQGETAERKLFFNGNQNRLVEVFRRLKYNGFLFETWTGIRDWLCNNFLYLSKTEVRNLNPQSVWDILSKAKGEPSPKSRICRFVWLPYRMPAVLK
ncbi:MAG: hypothetical protein HGB11_15600 [Chlorobiales bacterium]|nr:hypothetical protein [Chlorobiales bacterium]